jgi:TolB protein
MKKIIIVSFSLLFIHIFSQINAQHSASKMGSFSHFSNIGSPAIPGTISYSEPIQKYSMEASGANIWFGHDSFSFLWKKMNGDFIVQTQIRFIGDGHELHRKTGIMFRASKDADAPMVACTVHGDGLTSLQYRKVKGEDIKEIIFKNSGPDVIQLEKQGDSFIMSAAHFGELYHVEKLVNLEIGEELLAGLFLCSHNESTTEQVEFTNTRIFNPAPETLVQYKEYLNSMLEVMDVETGHRQVLLTAEGSIQAPNWTPDGKTLIYNSAGLLYNFDIATEESSVLNTDFANKNNNDHVLTFDGKQIGISHHAEETGGGSLIYTLPIEGGVPKKITDQAPSYLHGWSPDSEYLIYTAKRNGNFDIYRISKDGGKEMRLTNTEGLDDGSEYSPDGKYIYFNSSRSGTMQIWRMDADGRNQTQLTFDQYNDWFPHISPDNKWIAFISFSEKVQAEKHPFYERVYLRLMPVEGGEVKVIGYLYGGQGSINVPNWSPDSKKIAFVSNGYF